MNNQNASIMSLPPGLSSVPNTPDDFQLFINHSDEHQQTARQAVGVHQEELHRLQQQTEQAYAELAQKYRQLLQKYSQDSEDLKNEAESRRMWQGRFNEKQKELERLQVSTESSPFAAVILDGDGAIFNDELVAKGHEGGVEAAHRLLANVKNQCKNIYPQANVDDWSIFVQIAMNLSGLGKKLSDVGIIQSVSQLGEFARGFTYTQPLFSIVNVGSGKERADAKCREMARFMSRNKQCKHMFFGPCHDAGYLPTLESLREPYNASRLTLVETCPALPGFRILNLPITKFVVFRTTPLPDGNVPLSNGHPARRPSAPAPAPQSLPLLDADSPTNGGNVPTPRPLMSPLSVNGYSAPLINWAVFPTLQPLTSPVPINGIGAPHSNGADKPTNTWAVVSKNGTAPNGRIDIASSKKPPAPKYYLINKNGERVDEELPKTDPSAKQRYEARQKKLGNHCNEYHLKGVDCDAEYCSYIHLERLSKAEALVLQHKARGGVCNFGSGCNDPDCYYGHTCRYGSRSCTLGAECRFQDFHHVDTNPCYRVYEDGKKERVG